MACLLSLSLACGPSADGDAADSSGSDADEASAGVSSSDGGGTLAHGTIPLEFRRGDSQSADPFVGTARVTVTVTYRDCLQSFYDANPSMRQEGPEGEAVFGGAALGGEGWMDRLCTDDDPAQAACQVESITQRLDVSPQLSVVYLLEGELENRRLQFGPLPTKETAGCNDPIVRFSAANGRDPEDVEIWVTESYSPTEAVTNQGGAIVVRAARVEG